MERPPSWKIEKSPHFGRDFTDFDEIWHSNTVSPPWTFRPLKFQKFKNPRWSGRHLGKSRNRHILAAIWQISTKFDTATQFHPLERSDCSNFKNLKIQDGCGRHLWNRKIAISRPRFDRFWRSLTRWCSFALALMQTEIPVISEKSNLKGK